jgi:hypothetical protein
MYVRQGSWLAPHVGAPPIGLGDVLAIPPLQLIGTSQTSVNDQGAFSLLTSDQNVCVPGADPSNPFCSSAAGQAAAAAASSAAGSVGTTQVSGGSGMGAGVWVILIGLGALLFLGRR